MPACRAQHQQQVRTRQIVIPIYNKAKKQSVNARPDGMCCALAEPACGIRQHDSQAWCLLLVQPAA